MTLAAFVAVAVYLFPVALLVASKVRRPDTFACLSVEIPALVAIDLLGTFLLARFVPLDVAAWTSRGLWAVVGVVAFWRWRQRGTSVRMGPLDRTAIVAAFVGAAVAVSLSLWWSLSYSVWDRAWHVPLVGSLRGQHLPFRNVLFQDSDLRYHFPGDALGAIFQSLSFDVLHADHALSLAHDTMFGLTGACLALLLRAVGYGSVWSASAGALALLLGGPVTILRHDGGRELAGYSLLNYFSMSYRPHVSLAGLIMTGFLGVVVLRLLPDSEGNSPSRPIDPNNIILFSTTTLLAITDEASAGLLGAALGAAWLVERRIIARGRRRGAFVLFGLLAAFAAAPLLFGGALAPGGPLRSVRWMNWRVPGYLLPSIDLDGNSEAWQLLLLDMFAIPATLAAFLIGQRRLRSHGALAAVTFAFALGALAIVGLTRLEVNEAPIESHRFTTAALFCSELFALAWLTKVSPGSLARGIFVAAVLLPAVSTLAWLRLMAPRDVGRYLATQHPQPARGTVNCRTQTNARLGETTQPRYVASALWQLWGGCRPSTTPGMKPISHWAFPIETSLDGPVALELVERRTTAPDQPVIVICPPLSAGPGGDSVCSYAMAKGLCRAEGSDVTSCNLSTQDRVAILHR